MTTPGSDLEFYMLELINAERAAHGLNPLQLERNLNQSAEDHSQWMLEEDVFSHTGAGGSNAGDRMRDADFTFSGSWAWGENIGFQSERGEAGLYDDVADIHQRLMESPGHRANILDPDYQYIGIGIEYGNYTGYDGVMITQNFAKTSASVIVDDPQAPEPDAAATPPVIEVIRGTDGANLLLGDADDDVIRAGAGRDTVRGDDGADSLFGGAGGDVLEGGAGDDILNGGNGKDWLRGGAGADEFRGGRGHDVADYYDASTSLIADLENNNANSGAAAGDTYYSIAWLRGSSYDDELRGDDLKNRLLGRKGDDTLNGRAGDDTLDGGAGQDVLRGNTGDDLLLGRRDADRFIFETGMGSDTVADFQDNSDMLDFRALDLGSLANVMSYAEQRGADVVFDLAGADEVIIENATLAQVQDDILF